MAIPTFSSAAEVNLAKISACCSLGMGLRGDVRVRDRDSSGMTSGYVGGSMTCNANCAILRKAWMG